VKVSRRVNVIGWKSIGAMVSFPVMPAGIKSENNNSFARKALDLRGIQRWLNKNYGEV
jgi:hypothetical protein